MLDKSRLMQREIGSRPVNEIEMEVGGIEEEYNQGRCARGWCVNCWSHYKVSKRSVNLKTKDDLRLTEQFLVARQPSPEPVIEIEDEPIQNQPSTQHTLQQLLDFISDPRSGIIGLYVSATPNIQNIQTRISERLGLDLSNTSEDGARDKLSDALKKKKFLLILDDVWQQLELKNVGIPHPARSHKGSKIILTSRNQDVCTDMDADFTMKAQPLSGDERYEGLPLAIVTVACAMENRHGVGEWANAEREMKESVKDIRDHNIRKDYEILDFCIGEGLVDRLGSLTAARNKGEALIGSLKAACMLEDGEYEGSVRMHDRMRELALWITSPESDSSAKFLIRTGGSIVEAPQAIEWGYNVVEAC
ncbi:hypothetical protein NE237_025840 [Protea cynaroides]|uniref:NB-ARC domain-containing protein n=1 Tax=Protea cynaroides TaxID=273540 RepID=A0A9Q0JZX5_9MAGN|nr:hypothetical protein NE237_025840 [Protea cynaroides]